MKGVEVSDQYILLGLEVGDVVIKSPKIHLKVYHIHSRTFAENLFGASKSIGATKVGNDERIFYHIYYNYFIYRKTLTKTYV